jgi:beta-lactamase class C
MTSASMTRAGLKASGNWARPYQKKRSDARPRLQIVNDSYYNVPAAGGVNSSILDLAEYMRAQMGLRPDVLSQEVLDTIHAPRIRALRNQSGINRRYGGQMKKSSYGYGWRSYIYSGGHKVVGHRGAVRGYRAMILFDPERDTGVAVLWNSNSRKPVGIQFEVMDMVYGLPRKDWIGLDKAANGAAPVGAN